MSIWWSLQLRREASSVPLARRLLAGAMDTAGVDADIAHELSLALTEACANAVQHGGHSGAYQVTASIDGDICRIEVTDSGPGFPLDRLLGELDPLGGLLDAGTATTATTVAHVEHVEHEMEHGRGLRLIEALSDRVRYDNQPDRGGAVISFDKILKWREDSLLQAS
ncbi:ATP-binding protein [Streptomyces bohaiensis]|uniref:ATP-binding protein n=1 Tax=Streptomyces bohaiensis TaxID=1431344 RepID=A0ABX1CH82_9ACTN|nr:ATP-binding protein [Streptomyces bohaiensis]NJQ15799.1 ATP-binding protein [Streptomyces bohaiensis]